MTRRRLHAVHDYWELVAVGVAAVLGLTVQSPLVQIVRHQRIDALLAVLVFSTALSIEPRSLRRLPASWRQLSLALGVGTSILPAASWLKALLLTTSMRDFAIAAALATAAFGPAAAAPLGIYGITVPIWGTGSAGFMRRLQV
jgi:predicted Na+-dependent transporter